jgi:proline dehydrogenase
MKSIASKHGLQRQDGFAREFVAGEAVCDAVTVARQIESAGMTQTLDYLGPTVATIAQANDATRTCIGVINELAAAGIGRNLSLKLTQFGLAVDRATCVDNLRRLLDPAGAQDFFVRIDMEDSRYTQVTLDVFETLWEQGYHKAGIVIQAYLRRSVEDARRMNALGASVRLVKGAYAEPGHIAYRARAQVNRAFIDIMQLLLTEGTYPAIATHDPALIDATKQFARAQSRLPDRYEFQMLYGVRRDLQLALTAEGHRVRIYVPFGGEWFPYLMRRLGERPRDVGFILRKIVFHR